MTRKKIAFLSALCLFLCSCSDSTDNPVQKDTAHTTTAISATDSATVTTTADFQENIIITAPETGNGKAAFCDMVLEANNAALLAESCTGVTYTGKKISAYTGEETKLTICLSMVNGEPAASGTYESAYGKSRGWYTSDYVCHSDSTGMGSGSFTVIPTARRASAIDEYIDIFFVEGEYLMDVTVRSDRYIVSTGIKDEDEGVIIEKEYRINPVDYRAEHIIEKEYTFDKTPVNTTEYTIEYDTAVMDTTAFDSVCGGDVCNASFVLDHGTDKEKILTMDIAEDANIFASGSEGLVNFFTDTALTEPVRTLENCKNGITLYAVTD